MKGLRFALSTLVIVAAGCSLRPLADGQLGVADNDAASDTASVAPPMVQVRDFPHSSVVSVYAWEEDDAQLGLSTDVTRTGKLAGGRQAGDHRLYMNENEARLMGGFKYATVTEGKLLVPTRVRRDAKACFFGPVCTPMVELGVRIPDSLLRAHRDSFVITFHPSTSRSWSASLRPELVSAYLRSVDSVVAARH